MDLLVVWVHSDPFPVNSMNTKRLLKALTITYAINPLFLNVSYLIRLGTLSFGHFTIDDWFEFCIIVRRGIRCGVILFQTRFAYFAGRRQIRRHFDFCYGIRLSRSPFIAVNIQAGLQQIHISLLSYRYSLHIMQSTKNKTPWVAAIPKC